MKRLRAKIESCGLSFSKQMVIYLLASLSFFLAAGAFYFYRRQPHVFLYPVLLLLLFTFFYFSRYDGILKRNEEKDEIEFVALFTYFSIYIKDGFNVYNALEQIVPYASERIQERLKKLLAQIESDKTLQPYLDFAAPFHSLSVKEVMIAVYQMVDEGEGGVYIQQFSHLFGKFSDEKHAFEKKEHIRKLESLSSLPLVGSGITMLILLAGIMEVVGGMLHVV